MTVTFRPYRACYTLALVVFGVWVTGSYWAAVLVWLAQLDLKLEGAKS